MLSLQVMISDVNLTILKLTLGAPNPFSVLYFAKVCCLLGYVWSFKIIGGVPPPPPSHSSFLCLCPAEHKHKGLQMSKNYATSAAKLTAGAKLEVWNITGRLSTVHAQNQLFILPSEFLSTCGRGKVKHIGLLELLLSITVQRQDICTWRFRI